MKGIQLSHRIGNIDDQLVKQAENVPNYGRRGKKRSVRRMLAAAAVAALMACSFAIGAFALNGDPEIIELKDAGITLILPDDWKGKYICESDENGAIVYQKATYESKGDWKGAGILFYVNKVEGTRPMDYEYPMPGYTIASIDGVTYFLALASDVQYDPEEKDVAEEYAEMRDEIQNIQILLTDWMRENSVNQANWEDGTVYVDYLNADMETEETKIFDVEKSAAIQEILDRYEYSDGDKSFWTDVIIMLNGSQYWVNTSTGEMIKDSLTMEDQLSEEDLASLNRLIQRTQ